jgi:hypothetical protein
LKETPLDGANGAATLTWPRTYNGNGNVDSETDLPYVDVPSGSGFERVLSEEKRRDFNEAFKRGEIEARRRRIQ